MPFVVVRRVVIVFLAYENKDNDIMVQWKKPTHFPPHIHEVIEMVYLLKGTLELGIGPELYHMEKGDFAVVFPNTIHHYQVFESDESKALYMLVSPKYVPQYINELQKYCPATPVINKESLHMDVVNAVKAMVDIDKSNARLVQAYMQMIFAHIFSEVDMVEKESMGSNDLVYRSIEYVAKNFRTKIALEQMADDLGVSKYMLSRLFAKTFHCNFAGYVNGVRLNHAVSMMDGTNESITAIYRSCGFESQRTFNRVFKERYRITPREYRNRREKK